ncbi:MAG: LysR substrate-binding domain-containing protein [Janthinobacterium lividum]
MTSLPCVTSESETSLFTRSSSGIALTPAGSELLVHARLMLCQLQRARADLAQHRHIGGKLSIGATAWVSWSLLPLAVNRFRALRPDVQLDIFEVVGTRHSGLRDGSLDMTIGLDPPETIRQELASRRLFAYHAAVVSRLGHPAAQNDCIAALAECSWVMSRSVEELNAPFLQELEKLQEDATGNAANVARIHYARSLSSVLALVEATDMLTLCPWPLLETNLMRGRFQAIPVHHELPEHFTGILTRRNDPPGALAQLFITCFLAVCEASTTTTDEVLRRIMRTVEFL